MKKFAFLSILALSVSTNLAAEPPAQYGTFCVACHATGVAGAPKTGDKAAWDARLSVGMDALIASAKKGKNAMPAMGLCASCSDDDFKKLIEYMATPQ